MSDAKRLLAELRGEVDELVAQLELVTEPLQPDEIERERSDLLGPVWVAVEGRHSKDIPSWRVRVIDSDQHFIYMHHPGFSYASDFEPFTVSEARKLAMALLAACSWAEGHTRNELQLRQAKMESAAREKDRAHKGSEGFRVIYQFDVGLSRRRPAGSPRGFV